MQAAQQLVVNGWHRLQAGDFPTAERYYRQALEADGSNPDAWYGLGLLHYQLGRLDPAVACWTRLVQIQPARADARGNLGVALARRGDREAAARALGEALRLDPDSLDVRNNLGNLLREMGRLDEAAACLAEVLARAPAYAAAQHNLGLVRFAQGRFGEAERHFRAAVRLQPGDAAAHVSLGRALGEQDRVEEALASFDQALRLAPDLAEAHASRAVALARGADEAGAQAAIERALRLNPASTDIRHAAGVALAELRQFDAALVHFETVRRERPDYPDLLSNRGDALRQCGRLGEALTSLRLALRLDPANAVAHHNLAVAYSEAGRLEDALAEYGEALRLRPDTPVWRRNRAITWLRLGDWVRGWEEFEWRWRCRDVGGRAFAAPRWAGENLAGKTILLHAEQGLGDTIHFVRYARLVRDCGGRVLLECPAALHAVLKGCPGVDGLAAAGMPLPPFDVHCPLMSLPHVFRTAVDTVPRAIPYLFADPARIERWRNELSGIQGFRVGVCWQGNPKHAGDRHRSFPLRDLAPVAAVPGVRLISLQRGPGVDQIAALDGQFQVTDLGERLDRDRDVFVDTAAVMASLDLVITCDSAVAHVAGALGAPTWLALSTVADWRWLLGRADTPWYPTMQLFRQVELGGWGPVFDAMRTQLEGRLHGVPRTAIPG